MPRLTPQRRAERRAAYLRAAWRCFARDGIHDVTMDQISAEAGTSAGAVYLYFDSKEAVIRAAIAATLDRFGELAVDAAPDDSLEAILALVERVAVTEDGVDLFALAVQGWGFAQTDAEAATLIAASYRRLLDTWARRARERGLGARAAREHAQAIGCVVLGFVAQRALLGGPAVPAAARGVRSLAAR